MAFNVIFTSGFKKDLKRIAKKHRQILADVNLLIAELSESPKMGTYLGGNIYKIRVSISGTSTGKSGGVRVITYVKIVAETVFLTEIYLKSEFATVDIDEVVNRLKAEGLV